MTWAPVYASADELKAWTTTDAADPEINLALESASRAVDGACGRQFGLLSSSEFRWYNADYYRGKWIVDIDDLMYLPTAVEVNGTEVDYNLLPFNAAACRKPWTQMEIESCARDKVKVTARWGWDAVPLPVQLATLIQASRLLARRDSPAGPLLGQDVDDVAYKWGATTGLDDDVRTIVGPFRRYWVAV